METKWKTSPYFKKENPFLIINILLVLIGAFMIIRFWKNKMFWMGIIAVIIMGTKFWSGPAEEKPEF